MTAANRWSLSPAYDINPVPEIDRVLTPKTAINEYQEETSIAAAMATPTIARFGLKASETKLILSEVFSVVSEWRKTGRHLRIKSSTLDAYENAFDHALMAEARNFLRL